MFPTYDNVKPNPENNQASKEQYLNREPLHSEQFKGLRKSRRLGEEIHPPSKNTSIEEGLEKTKFERRMAMQEDASKELSEQRSAKLDKIPFCFTKGGESFISAAVTKDMYAERAFADYLKTLSISKDSLLQRYKDYDPDSKIDYPENHYALRLLTADADTLEILRWQVFSCPCFNRLSFELRDSREQANTQINLPQAELLFDKQTQAAISKIFIDPKRRAALEYGHAVLHELGHYVEPVVIAPELSKKLEIGGFELDFAGEFATDAHAGSILGSEGVDMALYTFVVRAPGHWLRRGFREDNQDAWINSDNDSLVSAVTWGFLKERGVICPSDEEVGKWRVKTDLLPEMFREMVNELKEIMTDKHSCISQATRVMDFAKRYVPNDHLGFHLEPELKECYNKMLEIPDVPKLTPKLGVLSDNNIN